MGFDNLNTDASVVALNNFLVDKSYIEGYNASQADVSVFEALNASLLSAKYPHASRWYKHISSMKTAFARYLCCPSPKIYLSFLPFISLPGTKKAISEYGPSVAAAAPAEADEDIDLFGSDEEDPELERAKAERLAAYNAKKAAKGPGPVAKSSVILDVKPWDDETDLAAMEKAVREITMDGLLWGASKLVPIGYGIRKLQISCVIEDDKVGLDMISDSICELEDLVQSVDVVSFNKV